MHKNCFLICLALIWLVSGNAATAQQAGSGDVVYLKDGTQLRGRLLKVKAGQKLKLRAINGNKHTLKFSELDSLVKEPVTAQTLPEDQQQNFKGIRFTNITELAYAGGNGKQKVNSTELKFDGHQSVARVQTVNGLQLDSWLTAGLGMGLDFFMTGEFMALPVFLDVRATPKTDKTVLPQLLLSGGYAMKLKKNDKGAFTSAGLGLKIKRYNHTAMHLSLNYRLQQFGRTEDVWEFRPNGQYGTYVNTGTRSIKNIYNLAELRFGYSF